ncbi:hypothetical protein SteCoe_16412 [Stentor coeruleus]|uniref:Uncharacterized protein n=1 Tax=Stentor coeruleus TaxID=5963 RepID=A0A1R2C1K6_9CILI|nr:hypothetical protein SteCoe_16412 [Stentor coeruleus]
MSIYSGFSMRSQEVSYNQLVENLILHLQARVLSSLRNNPRKDDLAWAQKFNTIYSNMKNLEYNKNLVPKLTENVREIASHFSFDVSAEPIFSDFSMLKFNPKVGSDVVREIDFSSKKNSEKKTKGAIQKVKNSKKKTESMLGMSKYYGKFMNNFLSKPKSVSPKKDPRTMISMETQDFWLLDDNIQVIDNEPDF